MARYLSDDADLIMHVVTQIGPPDVSPYITLVAEMEQALGIPSARFGSGQLRTGSRRW